ncbi:uncharacterized protein LOC144468005 [Augochlora pura]
MYQRNRESFPDFQKMLIKINCLSRIRILLNECMAILKEVKTVNIEELLASGEFHELYDEGIAIQNELVDSVDSLIIDHKITIKHLELNLMENLDYYGKQIEIQTKLCSLLQYYCANTTAFLKKNTTVKNCFKKDARLVNRFKGKCKKLKKILYHINERREFLWGIYNSGVSP